MKVYSIFDDFPQDCVDLLKNSGVEVTVHPLGIPRPDRDQMKTILEGYDGVIIGTSQKISEDMFENIISPRIIATASVGVDHINIPDNKKRYIKVINTPKANARSVAEYTMGCALACCKRLIEGGDLYRAGKNNKALFRKPEDLSGKTIGVVGAGNISMKIMEYARFFGMNVLCWTRDPNRHSELKNQGVHFTSLPQLMTDSDVISVNLPNNSGTKNIISAQMVEKIKSTSTFISVSRLETVDANALIEKAKLNPGFYVCLDLDVNQEIADKMPHQPNVIITPHIAGGTVETRLRMFREVSEAIRLEIK